MFSQPFFEDRVTQYKNRYRETENPDGSFTHERVEGEIIQQGTPHNQTIMNTLGNGIQDSHMAQAVLAFWMYHNSKTVSTVEADLQAKTEALEQAISENAETADFGMTDLNDAIRIISFGNLQQQRQNEANDALMAAEALGELQEITLTNNQRFPFNSTVDSPRTVALSQVRKNLFYSIEAIVISHEGMVGDVQFSDKALNGFKISFTGSGTSVTLAVRVKGGMT